MLLLLVFFLLFRVATLAPATAIPQLLPGIARDMRQLYIHSFGTRAVLWQRPGTREPKLPDSRFYVNFAYMTLFHLSSAQHRITLIDLRNVIASSKCLGSSFGLCYVKIVNCNCTINLEVISGGSVRTTGWMDNFSAVIAYCLAGPV